MSIKIEREIISPRKNYSYVLSHSKSNSDILYKPRIIINNSSSKAMYSFPTARRFPKEEEDYSTFFFEKPSTLNQRKAFIGYGNRSTILLNRSGKTDMYYDLPPSINAYAKDGCPKYTFGFSRAVCRVPVSLDQRKTPGPSSYFPYEKFGKNGAKYSMSFRYKYKKEPDNFPGPGSYEIPGLNKQGKYINSNYKNLQIPKFGKSKRFIDYDFNIPGPGAYNQENLTKGNGIIFNSKFGNSIGRTMGKKLKKIKDKFITPGPGAYEVFSEFQGLNRRNYVQIRKTNINEKNKIKRSSCSSRATSALTRRTLY